MEDGKRGRLMGDPDEWVDPDNRNLEQQLNDLGVEVIRVRKVDEKDILWVGPKDDTTKLEEMAKKIEAAGQKGLVSPQMALKHSKEKIEGLLTEGYGTKEMTEKLEIGKATLHSLRKVHDINMRAARKKKLELRGDMGIAEKAEDNWIKANPRLLEDKTTITSKTIRTNAQAAGGEVLGTAKMLEKLGDLPVIVVIKVMERV